MEKNPSRYVAIFYLFSVENKAHHGDKGMYTNKVALTHNNICKEKLMLT
jgi:hypothetical protein